MKSIITFIALALAVNAQSQIEVSSIGASAKSEYYHFKDSKIYGSAFTFQSVLNDHFILNAEYSMATDTWITGESAYLWGVNRGTFIDHLTTVGGNIGYRFHPKEKIKVDLMAGLFRYSFDQHVVYDVRWIEDGFSRLETRTDYQSAQGIGGNVNLTASWLFSKYMGLNMGIGLQSHQHTEPYIQIGLELGLLR